MYGERGEDARERHDGLGIPPTTFPHHAIVTAA